MNKPNVTLNNNSFICNIENTKLKSLKQDVATKLYFEINEKACSQFHLPSVFFSETIGALPHYLTFCKRVYEKRKLLQVVKTGICAISSTNKVQFVYTNSLKWRNEVPNLLIGSKNV